MQTSAPVASSKSVFDYRNYKGRIALWLAQQVLLVLGIALVITTLLMLIAGRTWPQVRARFATEFVYTLMIGVACSSIIQSLTHLATLMQARSRANKGLQPKHWIGRPTLTLILLIGTMTGYTLGLEVANWLMGSKFENPFTAGLNTGLMMLKIALLPGIVITIYLVARGHLDAASLRAQTAQRVAAESKLRLLASQLEPHMLFNTLANLRVLIGLDPLRAQAMLDQLIAFFACHPERFAQRQPFAT